MKKIDKQIIKKIRSNFLSENNMTIREIGMFEHLEYSAYLETELKKQTNIDNDLIQDVAIFNLYRLDSNKEIIDNMYEEEFMLKRINGDIPLNLSMKQLNVLDLGSYSWVEYGSFDLDNSLIFYDIETLEGVNNLFELKYFKRIFSILFKYLNSKGFIKNKKINTNNIEIIKDFNKYFIEEINKYDSILDCINDIINNK